MKILTNIFAIIIGTMSLWFFYLKIDNQLEFNSCIERSIIRYDRRWQYYCQTLENKNDCKLLIPVATEILDKMYEDQEICARIYK